MLVSCLTVSKPDRWGLLQRSIIDFKRQSVGDKELIVAVTDERFAAQVEEFIDNLNVPEARVIRRDQRDQTSLLLHAQAASRGEYLAIWDDDNQNDPQRLSGQITEAASDKVVSILSNVLYYFYETAELFMVGLEKPNVVLSQRAAITSLVIPRKLMPAFTHVGRNQSSVQGVADSFAKSKTKVTVMQALFSHMVGVRGDNLRGEEYHRKLVTTSPLTKSAAWLKDNQAMVSKALEQFIWEPVEISVSGPDGVAFKYDTVKRWSSEGNLYPIGKPSDGVERTTERVG